MNLKLELMYLHDVIGEELIHMLIRFVEQNEYEIESGKQGTIHFEILGDSFCFTTSIIIYL